MRYRLENEWILLEADTEGAELVSIRSRADYTEYLWQADPAYWKRHAPVLFPIVGSVKNKALLIDGTSYPMGQHGFARDAEFVLSEQTDSGLCFCLKSNEETKKKYPYDFLLKVGYELEGRRIRTTWTVENTGSKEMHYQIGGHPAFNCPLKGGKRADHFLLFDSAAPIRYGLLNENGLLTDAEYELKTEDGFTRITDDMFDKDALIVEHAQAERVCLCGPDKKPYVTVCFDSPLFGLWSPAGKCAPFVCIEPWFGRADRDVFCGSIGERDYDQMLKPSESRSYSFTVWIGSKEK